MCEKSYVSSSLEAPGVRWKELGAVAYACIPALRRPRERTVSPSLGYTGRPQLKKKKNFERFLDSSPSKVECSVRKASS